MPNGPILALVLTAPLLAQEDKPPDATKVLNSLMQANEEKDLTSIAVLLKDVIEVGRTAKSADAVGGL